MATIDGECKRMPEEVPGAEPPPKGGAVVSAPPKEAVCCLDPGCKATQSCMRPRCDYPGAGA